MNNLFALIRRSLFVVPLIALCFFLVPSHAAGQNADLSISKSGPAIAAAGTDITYGINVSNFSGEDSTPVNTLTDALPAGTTFVSETHPDPWSCVTPAVGSGGTITCTNSDPIPNESVATFSFVVHIAPNATGTLENTATISHGGEDPNPNNNSSTVFTTIGEPPPPPLPPLQPHDVLISEFRLSGPEGNSDEYVEFYCNRDTDCDLSGAKVRNYNTALPGDAGPGDLSSTFPQGTIIPARQYMLIGDSTEYSLSSYGILDFNVHNPSVPDYFNDNQGLQVLSAGGDPAVLDSVGFIGGGDDFQFIEGTGLEPATAARPSFQYAYVRKRTLVTNGLPQDTDNNADDFVLVSVTGTPHPGITAPPVLGAPGPQGLSSALTYSNSEVTWSLVEPDADSSASPNRVRTGSGDSGTISFRRSFTNNTNLTFDYIAFRVIEIPTLNSPHTLDDQAQLRLITSPNAESFTNSQGRPVNIRGTELEYDPGCGCEPAQPIGGGLNSTVSVNLSDPETEEQIFVGPGQTIDVQFLLDVDRPGNYRFFVYVEAFPASQQCGDCPVIGSPKAAGPRVRVKVAPHVPRKLINLKSSPKAVAVVKKPKNSAPIPTKSFTGRNSTPSVTPVRVFVFDRPVTTTNRKRRKLRVRRKASPALRAKAEARGQDKPQN